MLRKTINTLKMLTFSNWMQILSYIVIPCILTFWIIYSEQKREEREFLCRESDFFINLITNELINKTSPNIEIIDYFTIDHEQLLWNAHTKNRIDQINILISHSKQYSYLYTEFNIFSELFLKIRKSENKDLISQIYISSNYPFSVFRLYFINNKEMYIETPYLALETMVINGLEYEDLLLSWILELNPTAHAIITNRLDKNY